MSFLPLKAKKSVVYKRLRLIALLVLSLFALGMLGFILLKGTGPQQAFELTLESLAFHYNANETGVVRFFQLTLILFGVIIFWTAFGSILDLFLEGKLYDYWKEVKSIMTTAKLKKHYIICGAGGVGMHAAALLSDRNLDCVVIDSNKQVVEYVQKKGITVVHGDALEEETLKEAGIEHALAVLAVLPKTESNVLITLMTKSLNPRAIIYARSENQSLVKQLHNAGAKHVILPEEAGAKELVDDILKDNAPKEFGK